MRRNVVLVGEGLGDGQRWGPGERIRVGWIWAHVEVVHLALLEITVGPCVVEGVEGVPAVLGGELVSVVGLCEETAHLLVFLQEAAVLLLELANLDEGRGERGDLVGGEAQGGLEFCDGLFELLDVGLSLCTMAGLCFCITAALWTIGL